MDQALYGPLAELIPYHGFIPICNVNRYRLRGGPSFAIFSDQRSKMVKRLADNLRRGITLIHDVL